MLAALFVLFGTLALARVIGAPPRMLLRLAWPAWIASVLALLLWTTLESADLTEAGSVGAALAAVPRVIWSTQFGMLVLVRLATLAMTGAALAGEGTGRVALVLAGIAVGLQAAHLHALAIHPGPSVLFVAEVLHVLAAGAWLGALPGIWTLIRVAPFPVAEAALRLFAPFGIACVLVLAATASIQCVALDGGILELSASPHGVLCIGKILLFVMLVGFALRHRLVLVPCFLRDGAGARRTLALSVALETLTGVIIVMLAVLLSTQPLGIDAG